MKLLATYECPPIPHARARERGQAVTHIRQLQREAH